MFSKRRLNRPPPAFKIRRNLSLYFPARPLEPDGQGGRELVALRDSSAPSTTSRPSRRSEDAKPNRLQKKIYATSSRATITSEDVKTETTGKKSAGISAGTSHPGSRRTFGVPPMDLVKVRCSCRRRRRSAEPSCCFADVCLICELSTVQLNGFSC